MCTVISKTTLRYERFRNRMPCITMQCAALRSTKEIRLNRQYAHLSTSTIERFPYRISGQQAGEITARAVNDANGSCSGKARWRPKWVLEKLLTRDTGLKLGKRPSELCAAQICARLQITLRTSKACSERETAS